MSDAEVLKPRERGHRILILRLLLAFENLWLVDLRRILHVHQKKLKLSIHIHTWWLDAIDQFPQLLTDAVEMVFGI